MTCIKWHSWRFCNIMIKIILQNCITEKYNIQNQIQMHSKYDIYKKEYQMNKEIQEIEYILILLYIIKRYHLLETTI